MSISPESCLANNKTGWCETKVDIRWQLVKEKAVCLKVEHLEDKYCFDKAMANSFQLAIKTQEAVKFQLIDGSTDELLASSVLNVFVREYRKRNRQRHAWSVIQ